MSPFRRWLKGSLAQCVIALVIGAVIALIVLIESDFVRIASYYDALTTAGAVVILVGLLVLVTYHGAFDIFGYAFKFHSTRRRVSYSEYMEKKKEGRSPLTFLPYLIVGAVILGAGLLLRIWM